MQCVGFSGHSQRPNAKQGTREHAHVNAHSHAHSQTHQCESQISLNFHLIVLLKKKKKKWVAASFHFSSFALFN